MNTANADYLNKHRDFLSIRNLNPKTIDTYCSYMSSLIDWTERVRDISSIADLSWEDIRSYINYLKDTRGLKANTINVHIAQLKDFYQCILHKEWNSKEIPCLRVDQYLPHVPTKEQLRTILSTIDNPKHKAELVLLYSSGLRVSELCRLHCGDIYHKENPHIFISRSKNRSERFAVLSERAYEELVAYIRSSYQNARKEDWLFPGQKPGAHTTEQTVYMAFKKHLAALGLQDQGFNLHSLRHAFGLHLYENGADLMSIKEAMGHKSLASTAIYLTLGIGSGRSVTSPYDTLFGARA